ncbi:M36 family metallopeptidase [Marinicella rhabdoformis]|uniref:M36 family metallopeptidase n=1 Tax=Marinicella rhabdoformis TaxID=2580566 RepID=UPI0012AEC7E7|nr:M36 family metallopeptidase [Marinicella rhabdoformis]
MIKKTMVAAVLAALYGPTSAGIDSNMSQELAWAKSQLTSRSAELNISDQDLSEAQVLSSFKSQHNGISHIVLRQHINGIEVEGADVEVNLDKNGQVINIHNRFIPQAATKANDTRTTISADQAIMSVANQLGLQTTMPTYRLNTEQGVNRATTYLGDGISREDIPVKLVYQADKNQQPRLAWDMQIQEGENWWSIRVDANTGDILSQYNWSAHASYDVIPFPSESPTDTGYALATVTNPEDMDASPYGWHDTDGIAGAEYTDTRGNNVFAQDDLDANNSGGSRPDGGAGLVFDVPWNPAVNPDQEQNLDSAIVNLFYWNNIIHDLMYHYGFDEASGNFQEKNYGNSGNDGDAVNADAQDGNGTNNANFGTPPDGSRPRMQMYYFNAPLSFLVNAPANIAGPYTAGAGFGGEVTPTGVTGDLELVDDGTDTTSDACTAINGFTPGNIALIDRGSCEFGDKALNAENAGASAVIIVNNAGDEAMSMGEGTNGGQVTIPTLSLGQSNGDILKNELVNGVNVTMKKANVDRDSDFDNGIIIHEYGHGISNRLTGGAGNASCLQTAEQMGEGWSDYFALFMTADSSDTADQAMTMGSYATQNNRGIRTYPYSRDMQVNPHTFEDLEFANGSPHYVGSIWAVMLWEVYWNLVDKYGFDADLYQGTGGNNMALQLVMDGLKLQGCNPGFIDGRDGILLADQQNNAGANQCEIWKGFAKRGLGVGADSGNVNATGDETESFDIPAECEGPTDIIFKHGFEFNVD